VEFYTVIKNVELFLRAAVSSESKLQEGRYNSLVVSLIVGTAWIFSPVYGWLSDSKFGHYPVLVGCLATYVVGGGLVCGSALTLCPGHDHGVTDGLYYSGLCLIVLVGVPGMRSTAMPFMLEQLTAEAEQRHSYLTKFVNWSYFFTNMGVEIALLLGGYLQSRRGPFIDRHYQGLTGFFWRYLLGFISLVIALGILCVWRNRFKRYRPHITSSPSITAIFKTACCRKPRRQHIDSDLLRQYEREPSNEEERMAKKQQEDVQRLANLVPFMGTMMIYFLIYSQAVNSFVLQGVRMNFQGSPFNQSIPPEDFPSAFDPLGVMVTIPFLLYVIKPLYEKIAGRLMCMLPRIRWGMILSASACAIASVVESIRVHSYFKKQIWHIQGKTVHYCYSELPIYTQVPQYFILGISEVLATVGFMEFVLSTSPREFRSTTFGILQMMKGIAKYTGAALLFVIESERPHWYYYRRHNQGCSIRNAQKSRPYVYFVILTWLMLANVVVYMIVEMRYKKFVRIAPLQRDWTT
jgi:dipeptide/tripeptide permease